MRDQKALALQCWEVEKDGGDVITFLKGLGFISPRATWERLQLNELGRQKNELTDGKKKGSLVMSTTKKLTMEMKKEAVERALAGENPLTYLAGLGIRNPSASWLYVCKGLQKADPVKHQQLEDMGSAYPVTRFRKRKPETPETVPAAETPEDDGPEYIRYNPDAEDDPMPEAVPAVQQEPEEDPEEDRKETDWRGRALMIGNYSVFGLEGSFGRYILSHSNGKDWIDFESDDTGDVLSLTVDNWREFIRELRAVTLLMGVSLDD